MSIDLTCPPDSSSPATLWAGLETIPGLAAPSPVWRARLGAAFTPFSSFLERAPEPAPSSPASALIRPPADATLWQLNWPMLGRALCQAFALESKTAQFPLPFTGQIGAWSADAVPAILTIQNERREFRGVVAELAARLRQPFILLAPTSAHLDAACQELLANFGAGFFALDSQIVLTEQSRLQSRKTAGELFAKFAPQPNEAAPEDAARQAFALVKALDSGQAARKVGVLTVFRLYCVEGLSARQIAAQCKAARSIIYDRLRELRQKLGRHPSQLRQYSPHLAAIEQSLSDPAARRLYRKGAVHGDE